MHLPELSAVFVVVGFFVLWLIVSLPVAFAAARLLAALDGDSSK